MDKLPLIYLKATFEETYEVPSFCEYNEEKNAYCWKIAGTVCGFTNNQWKMYQAGASCAFELSQVKFNNLDQDYSALLDAFVAKENERSALEAAVRVGGRVLESLLKWRLRTWPNTDQRAVLYKDYHVLVDILVKLKG